MLLQFRGQTGDGINPVIASAAGLWHGQSRVAKASGWQEENAALVRAAQPW